MDVIFVGDAMYHDPQCSLNNLQCGRCNVIIVLPYVNKGVHVNNLHVVYPGNQRIYSWANIDNLSK